MSRGALKVFSEAIASLFLQSSLKDPRLLTAGLGNWGRHASTTGSLPSTRTHTRTPSRTNPCDDNRAYRGKQLCVLSCLNASSFAVLIKPCWLLSMVDILLIPRPCGKSGGVVPFLTNPPLLDRKIVCPSHKKTLAQRRFPMSRKTPRRKTTVDL